MFLDTNAYSALAQGSQLVIDAVKESGELKLPLPVIAELRYGFVKGSKTEHNERMLQRFLAQPQVSIILPTIKTTEHYAELQLVCKQKGRALSQNDIWIAALARENEDRLITFDKDFMVLSEALGDYLIILDQ
jgi:predicted nucleic acid-binding protein